MKISLVLFLSLFSMSVMAQKSLSSQTFQGSIRPVLNAILHDYYQMVGLFPEFPKELGNLVEQLNGLHDDRELLLQKCPRQINSACLSNVKSLNRKLTQIEGRTLILISGIQLSPSLHISSLAGLRVIGDFQNLLAQTNGELANSAYMVEANVKHRRETYQVVKKLDELGTILSLCMVEYIPFAYKEDFRQVYFNFIHPIQTQISKSQNYEFFNKSIESLNFSYNLLNMTLTKRKKTPEGMAPYLSLIHNRWNSILRYYY